MFIPFYGCLFLSFSPISLYSVSFSPLDHKIEGYHAKGIFLSQLIQDGPTETSLAWLVPSNCVGTGNTMTFIYANIVSVLFNSYNITFWLMSTETSLISVGTFYIVLV